MKLIFSFIVALFCSFSSIAEAIPNFTAFTFGNTDWASFGTSYSWFLLDATPVSGSAPAEFAHDATNSRILLGDGSTRQFITSSSPAYIAFKNPNTGVFDSCFTTDVNYSDMVGFWGEARSRSDNDNRRFVGIIHDVTTCNGDRLAVDILKRSNPEKDQIKRLSFVSEFPVLGAMRTIHGEIDFEEFDNNVNNINWTLPDSCATPYDYCSTFFPTQNKN